METFVTISGPMTKAGLIGVKGIVTALDHKKRRNRFKESPCTVPKPFTHGFGYGARGQILLTGL